MVIYFANRKLKVIATASSDLNGNILLNDEMVDDVASGVLTYSCTLGANDEMKKNAVVGHFLLVGEHLFTIITQKYDTNANTISLYCEDAGLDLINKVCPPVSKTQKSLDGWIQNTLGTNSGWTVQYNGVKSTQNKTLEYTSETSATERLHDILDNFNDAEISFSYRINGLDTVERFLNVHKKRGAKTHDVFSNREVIGVAETKSLEEFATVLVCYGKDGKALKKLSGYSTYSGMTIPATDRSDFDFSRQYDYKISGNEVRCISKMADWKSALDKDGAIKQVYSYDNNSAKTVITKAIKMLEKIASVSPEYEVNFSYLPDGVECGDYMRVLDAHNEIMFKARVQVLTKSLVTGDAKATLGDFKSLTSSKAESRVAIYQLQIDSSNGIIGRGAIDTVLTVTPTLNGLPITNDEILAFGVLRWYEDGILLPADDPRISNHGFTFTTGSMTTGHNYKVKLEV